MKTLLISLLIIVLVVGGLFFYRDYYLKRKFRKITEEKYKTLTPLIRRVWAREQVTEFEILEVAGNPAVRQALFFALATCQRLDLFPSKYLTYEKGAESSMVTWLEFPTELGVPPDEIEFMEEIVLQNEDDIRYYAFRYRMLTPHWAKDAGWLIGVAGPYQKDTLPYDTPRRVFSRFNREDSTSVRSEVEWVHTNVNKG